MLFTIQSNFIFLANNYFGHIFSIVTNYKDCNKNAAFIGKVEWDVINMKFDKSSCHVFVSCLPVIMLTVLYTTILTQDIIGCEKCSLLRLSIKFQH